MQTHTRLIELAVLSLAWLAALPAAAQEFVDGLAQPVFAGQPTIDAVVAGIVDDSSIDSAVLAATAQSPNRLVYQTDPLMNPVHMSGVPAVSLRVAFNEPAAIVSAMLVDYRADGGTTIVTRGWADPQNRQSDWKTSPIKPGKSYKIEFDLQPHDYIFQPSSQIGLVLLSSERLFTLRPPPGAVLTVNTGKSSFTLPVVGGGDTLSLAAVR